MLDYIIILGMMLLYTAVVFVGHYLASKEKTWIFGVLLMITSAVALYSGLYFYGRMYD